MQSSAYTRAGIYDEPILDTVENNRGKTGDHDTPDAVPEFPQEPNPHKFASSSKYSSNDPWKAASIRWKADQN